jgi:LuxR family transcriptional regulator
MADKQDIRTVLKRLEDQSPTGFAIAFHIKFTTPEFLFQTYPKAWIDLYSERGYVMQDPTVSWGFANEGVRRWSDLASEDSAGILEDCKAFGMNFGVTVALERGGTRSLASFTARDREFSDAECAALEADLKTLHDMTQIDGGMDDRLRDDLHDLSVQMTHPGPSE